MSTTSARDLFRTPDELVLQDRLLSLGCLPCNVGIYRLNSGSDTNHFPHGVDAAHLPHLLTALRVHRDDAIVGALGPGVCESLWTWAQWDISAEMWAGSRRWWFEGPTRVWWPILGDTREDARRMRQVLEDWANEHHPQREIGYSYNFRGAWMLCSAHRSSFHTVGRWPWSSLLDTKKWPLVFGASRQGFEDMRAYRAGEGG